MQPVLRRVALVHATRCSRAHDVAKLALCRPVFAIKQRPEQKQNVTRGRVQRTSIDSRLLKTGSPASVKQQGGGGNCMIACQCSELGLEGST
jgi:hypothetical protein